MARRKLLLRRHDRRPVLEKLRPYATTIAVLTLIIVVSTVVVTIAPRIVGTNSPTIDGVLSIGPVVAEPPSTLWAVGAHAVKIDNTSVSAQLNETPITYFRWGGGGDNANQTTSLSYSSNGTASPLNATDASFVKFCKSRDCRAIFTVPGEINDPGAAALTVSYVEHTLDFDPAYWSIGNEPQEWTHFGIPWTSWRWTDESVPTPAEYAVTVQRDIAAMRTVDPNIRVIGIQSASGGVPSANWLTPLAALDGPNLSAIAYHSYPASIAPSGGTLDDFLSDGFSHGFPSDYAATEAAVARGCPSCHIPVFVDEYNGASAGIYSPFVQSYPDVPLVAAAVARGLQENVSQFSFFDLQATTGLLSFGLLAQNGSIRPTFGLYSYFFRNLSVGAVDNTTILGNPGDIAAVVATNATTTSLLVANVNPLDNLQLSLNGSGFPLSDSATSWSWNPNEPLPVVATYAAGQMPSSWLIPAEGILLVDVPN
jgi:hypothetical protein